MLDNKDIEYLNKLYINNHLYKSNYSYKINIKINKVCTNNYKMMLDKVYSDTNDIFLVYKLRKTIFRASNTISILLLYIILNIIDDELKRRGLIFNRYKNCITIYVNSYKAYVRVNKSINLFINNLEV